MRKILVLLMFVVMFGAPQSPQLWSAEEIRVTRAVDGETLQLSDGRSVRMIGVVTNDAKPILRERFKASENQIAGMALQKLPEDVMAYVETNVVGRLVILSFDPANAMRGHLDSEGRVLAYVWYSIHFQEERDGDDVRRAFQVRSEDRLLNGELIREGHAFADATSSYINQKLFLRYEQEAADRKLGMWRSSAQLYKDLLTRAKSAQSGSTAEFVPQYAREMGLQSSWKTFSEAIASNPEDYRGYYERSWLGANSYHDIVREENLKDIGQVVKLSQFDPKGYMQKSYLMRLLEKHGEAGEAYESAVKLARKYGMNAMVSDLAAEEIKRDSLRDPSGEVSDGLAADAARATLNEDHFLIFMSRYKSYGVPPPEGVEEIYKTVSVQGRFKDFYEKHRAFIEKTGPREILYKTQWAQKGHETPEDVIAWMETVGFYTPPPEKKETAKDDAAAKKKDKDKDVISVQGAEEEEPEAGVLQGTFE